jgi:hypothetical protein
VFSIIACKPSSRLRDTMLMARSARDGKGSWPQLAAFVVDGRTATRRMFPPYELTGRSDEPQRSQHGDTISTPASPRDL